MQLAVEKDLPSNEEVVEQRTGNLEKKGGFIFTSWQKRYVVLNGTTVDYSEGKGGKLKGSFTIDRGCEVLDKGKNGSKYYFMVKPKNVKREYNFRADNENEVKNWITSFDKAGKLAEVQMQRLLKVWKDQNDECLECYATSVVASPEATEEKEKEKEKEEEEKEKEKEDKNASEGPLDEFKRICSLSMQTIEGIDVTFKSIFRSKVICLALLRHFG